MLVLDLFSGLNGWGAPWEERGHTVISADNNPRFGADYQGSLLDVDSFIRWLEDEGAVDVDVILASPPCEGFSVMRINRNWTPDNKPRTEVAATGLALVQSTLEIISLLCPTYYVIENPRGKLRKLDVLDGIERHTVTYCQYGENRMKPTDLWGVFPPVEFKPMCKNGDPCHIRAPRGSFTGSQNYGDSAIVARIPRELSLDICVAAESNIARLV